MCNTNEIGAAICVAEYFDPIPNPETGDCDQYKKILILTSKCEDEDCFYWFKNGTKIETPTEEELMAIQLTPAPTTGPTCEQYPTEPFIIDNANADGVTLADLVALALGGDGGTLEYPSFGAVAATDKVLEVSIVAEDGDDVILIDGQEAGSYTYTTSVDANETFPGQTPITVPADCEFSVSVCFCKCLTKAEIAAL